MAFIDSHCHLDFSQFKENFDNVMSLAKENNVMEFIVPSVAVSNLMAVQALSDDYANVHKAFGLHPCFMKQHQAEDVAVLAKFVNQYRPIAIGEIGLDFVLATTEQDRKAQITLFEEQLALAATLELPVILHVRKAHDDILNILKKREFPYGGAVHAFNGSLEQAKRYTEVFGFKLGFGGTLTYQGSRKIRRLATQLPLSAILLETDAPDMPLSNMEKAYNQPANIKIIADALFELRKESATQVERQIELNTRECFGLF